MWGLFGIFMLGMIGGMLFGMMRGPKRTGKRIIVIVCFSIICIIITPWISSAFVKMALNFKVGDETLYQTITGVLPEEIGSALNTLPEVEAVMLGIPILVLNLIVFWILMLLFRFVISPIIEVLLLKKIFPKKDANGEKIPFNKWAGLGMGALQGFVLFLFMFIPVTGLMSTVDRIDGYKPKVGAVAVNVFDTGYEPLDEINKGVHELNKSIQETPIGFITKFTGTQLVGDLGLGRFMTVNAGKTSVNVKRECEIAFEVTRDAVVVYNMFADVENLRQIVPVFSDSKKVDFLNMVVNKVFRLGTIELALNSEFGEFVTEADLLKDVDMGIVDDQAAYNQSIYTGLSKINRNFIRDDILSMIEIVRLVFAEHPIAGQAEPASLYLDIDDLISVMSNPFPQTVNGVTYATKEDGLDYMFKRLDKTLTKVKFGDRNLAEQILHKFGNMNIFKELLLDPANPGLYSMPLGKLLGMNPEDAKIENFDAVMDGLANILVRAVRVGPTVYKLANGGEVTDLASILDAAGPETITAIGQILEILTNRGVKGSDGFYYYQSVDALGDPQSIKVMGTGNIIRKLLSDTISNNFNGSSDGVISFEAVLGSLMSKLSPEGPDIAWAAELNNVIAVVKKLGGMLNGEINPDELIDTLLDPDGDLLELIENSELLSEIIVDVLDVVINEILGGTGVKFDFGGVTNPVAVIQALGALVGTGVDMSEWLQNGLDGGGFNSLSAVETMFGGGSVLTLLANSGVKIEIADASLTLQDDIAGLAPTNPIKQLFRFI
jgi:hypothetical protein